MGIDPAMFKKLGDTPKRAIIESRVSDSDYVETKANIVATRIVTAQPQPEIEEEDYYEESDESAAKRKSFVLPSERDSRLVNPDIQLDESQIEAIKMLLFEQYGCLIGAAGSGKTTSLRFFLQKLIYGDKEYGVEPQRVRMLPGKQGLNIALVAFTGTATHVIKQNMPEWLHPSCKTIHSLLEYAPVKTEIVQKNGQIKESQIFMPMRHAQNKLMHDVIVIDESSMVGLELWHQLLDACKPSTKIFMIGDLNQLTPTASYSILAFTLAQWPVAELTHIHRQKEPAANRIIEVAHSILAGNTFEMDDSQTNHNWRVIGFKLDTNPDKAGHQVVAIANALRGYKVHASVDPETPPVYDPYRDRIITAGNGYEEEKTGAGLQQFWINEALSHLIVPPTDENPRIIIDAGRAIKKFEVGHRVMATKNESPDIEDRVTNGMVGKIVHIEKHPGWHGNHSLVGPEKDVQLAKKNQIEDFFNSAGGLGGVKGADGKFTQSGLDAFARFTVDDLPDIESINLSGDKDADKDAAGGGAASHKVHVVFQTGAIRVFSSKAQVESLMLAYASTCHKCQGSQFDTAIIVVHHSVKSQLSREWLYTAVTRAVKRVVFLYTDFGIRSALSKQKIFGANLAEKIKRYQAISMEGLGPLKIQVRTRIED
jgi:hypothetical protein